MLFRSEIAKLFQSAYKEWLPSSGYEKVEGRDGEIYDMEIYGVTEGGKFFEEVWLSVVKREWTKGIEHDKIESWKRR